MQGWLSRFMGGGGTPAAGPAPTPSRSKQTFDADQVGEGIGYERWESVREAWNQPAASAVPRPKEKLDVPGITESLSNPAIPFNKPVHLPDMVGILVELWEEDGLYNT